MRTRMVALGLVALTVGGAAAAGSLFSEDFENGIAAKWTGKNGGGTSAVVVDDPLRAGSSLSFTRIASAGDLFSGAIKVSKSSRYRLAFDYLGKPGTGGGIIGVSLATPGHHRWLAGIKDKGAGEKNMMVNDGKWHSYKVDFRPGDHTWFTPDGSAAVDPGAITSLRVMLETHLGNPGDAYFDNISLTQCAAKCSGGGGQRPFRVRIGFHAESLPTAAPSDGGKCTGARQPARVTGEINAQITPRGDHEGSGDVDAAPHRSRCRVPSIDVRVERIRLAIIEPGKAMRATLRVRISSEGVHRPGDCRVGTRGTITAIYDDRTGAANSLRDHSVRIGPWRGGGCDAHEHRIDNNISSITADASGSTWVRVNIACLPISGPGGYSPRNCE